MRVNALDHVNIVTERLADTVRFFAEVLDLEPRDPPPPLDPALARWMYDAAGRPIFHLSSPGALLDEVRNLVRSKDSGPVHHIALDCSGHDQMVERLGELGVEFHLNHVEAIDLRQIFVRDPNSILIELNYRAGNH